MAKFEDLGYCPFNEVVHNEEKVWNELSESEQGYRRALWAQVGPYMVCKSPVNVPYTVEAGKLFFGTKYLANQVLEALVKRYDFEAVSPIWIVQPRKPDSTEIPVASYILEASDKKPELIFGCVDAGKVVVVHNGDNGEVFVALWNTAIETQ